MNKEFYKNCKIYKVVDNVNPNNVYIGSTCKTLAQRISQHRTNYKEYIKFNKTKGFVSIYDIIENGDFDIILIENFPCNNKDEMNQKERYFIDTMECINKNTKIKNNIIVHEILKKEELEIIIDKKKVYRKEYYLKRVKNNEIDKDKAREYRKKYYNKKKDQQEEIIFNVIIDDLETNLNK